MYLILPLFALIACQSVETSSQSASETPSTSQTQAISSLLPTQYIVVLTENWDTPYGKMLRLTPSEAGDQYFQVGETIDVIIGKKGLGWGIGLADFTALEGPNKKEGDLKSPAGIFSLSQAFGYAPRDRSLKWAYTQVDSTVMCIEDSESSYYNKIVKEGKTMADWNSTDHMLRDDDLYEWGVFVDHNGNQQPGGGSCIFLHVWRKGGNGTAGCTSMDKGEMKKLVYWLDQRYQTYLVQLPKDQYASFQKKYDLPSLPL
ncbi:MAG: hypothetical protein AAFY71_20630 [Bacteroidota bacterium]